MFPLFEAPLSTTARKVEIKLAMGYGSVIGLTGMQMMEPWQAASAYVLALALAHAVRILHVCGASMRERKKEREGGHLLHGARPSPMP